MTDSMPDLDFDRITDEEMFTAALNAVLQAAYDNGVELNRPFECRNGLTYPDWDVDIIEVDKSATTASDDEHS